MYIYNNIYISDRGLPVKSSQLQFVGDINDFNVFDIKTKQAS